MKNNPYVGPRAFKYGEALHGRETEVDQLADLLIADRIVLLYSPSGAGKTSLIQAALIPKLEQDDFHVFPVIRVGLRIPQEFSEVPRANRYLISVILSLEGTLPPEQRMPAREIVTTTLVEYLEHRERNAGVQRNEVLLFDQFEEILTADPAAREAKLEFFEQVGTVLRDPNRWALFSMREEFQAAIDPYRRFIPARLRTRFRLELLGKDAARRAIQLPAHAAGVEFTNGAARTLVDDLRQTSVQRPDGTAEKTPGEFVEPVQLQVVCRRLWDRLAEGHTSVEQADIERIENVDAALAGYFDEQVANVAAETDTNERAIRDWFDHWLITEYGIRGQVLHEPERSRGLDNRAISKLVDSHLVRAENRLDSTWFELAHDRLIDPVRNSNMQWRERHLSLLQMQAEMWDKQHRPDALLLSGEPLKDAERWADTHANELTQTEERFLSLSRNAEAMAEREQRRNRIIQGLAYTLAVLSVGISYFAYTLWVEARPWGTLTNLTSGRVHKLAGETVSVGRSTEAIMNDVNLIYNLVSRVHLRIQKDRTAIDMRSLLGTTINGSYLPYGDAATLEQGDILTVAGIVAFQFHSIDYLPFQLWPAPVKEVAPARGWGVLIDHKNRKVHPLIADRHFVHLGSNGQVLVTDRLSSDFQPLVTIQRHENRSWRFEDRYGHGEDLGMVTLEDQDDDVPLRVQLKTGNTYTYQDCLVPPGKQHNEFPWMQLECKVMLGRIDLREDQLELPSIFQATYYLGDPDITFRIVPNLVGIEG